MGKLILSMNTTLTGVASDELSWIKQDTDQSWNSFFEMLSTVDLLLLGNGMWNDYRNYWTEVLNKKGANKNEIKYAQFAENTKHLIFSSTLKESGWANANVITGDLKQNIQQIKLSNERDIQIVGGVQFASSIINTGLVDEYRIMLNPVVTKRGKSLYCNLSEELRLDCFKAERMDNGVMILWYRHHITCNACPSISFNIP
jgi:dihydrofolate reductase